METFYKLLYYHIRKCNMLNSISKMYSVQNISGKNDDLLIHIVISTLYQINDSNDTDILIICFNKIMKHDGCDFTSVYMCSIIHIITLRC